MRGKIIISEYRKLRTQLALLHQLFKDTTDVGVKAMIHLAIIKLQQETDALKNKKNEA